MIILAVFASLILILTMLIWSRLTVVISFKSTILLIKIKLGFISFSKTIDIKNPPAKKEKKAGKIRDKKEKQKEKEPFSLKQLRQKQNELKKLLSFVEDMFIRPIKYFLRHTRLKRFAVRLDFGTGDAADTGIALGIIWAIWGNVLAFFSRYVNLKKTDIKFAVNPYFEESKFDLYAESIIISRLAHIINMFIIGFFAYLKYRSSIKKENKIVLKRKGMIQNG